MHCFLDKTDHKWTVELNVGTLKRVRAHCGGIDLVNVVDFDGDTKNNLLERIQDDPELLINIIFAICKDEAEKAGLDDFKFAELMDARAVEQAAEALIEEIINFSRPAKRKVLEKVYRTAQRVAEETGKNLETILNSPELEAEVTALLSKQSAATQESSE